MYITPRPRCVIATYVFVIAIPGIQTSLASMAKYVQLPNSAGFHLMSG